jgi:hypothetical protein
MLPKGPERELHSAIAAAIRESYARPFLICLLLHALKKRLNDALCFRFARSNSLCFQTAFSSSAFSLALERESGDLAAAYASS